MATRLARPDSVTLGEVVETPSLQRTYEGRLDGCLDFVLMQALRRFFAFGDVTASEFDAFLRRHRRSSATASSSRPSSTTTT